MRNAFYALCVVLLALTVYIVQKKVSGAKSGVAAPNTLQNREK